MIMDEIIEIQWTSASLDEARKVTRYLVQERLVASAQIIPWLESIFLLDGQLDTLQESKVLLKTTKIHFETIKKHIEANSSYQIPEITYTRLDYINNAYRDFLLSAAQ
jgi:Uncharacterized protein involved in tolerance to divalent cations